MVDVLLRFQSLFLSEISAETDMGHMGHRVKSLSTKSAVRHGKIHHAIFVRYTIYLTMGHGLTMANCDSHNQRV